jgi:hypothetical protein
MTIKRMIVLATIAAALAAAAPAPAAGLGLGAGAFDGDFGVHLRKDFALGGDISAITGQAGVYFPSKTTFRLDADYHFLLKQGASRFYPLVGVDFAFNSDHARFGLNAGGGVNFKFTEKTAGFAEAKFVLGDWDGFAFAVGIYF